MIGDRPENEKKSYQGLLGENHISRNKKAVIIL